ncbi:MAG: hypothetical protein FWF09_03110 [Bacteroidales bacterium]|nr:hypothetical protein [Bacteroidales bacterium]
MMRFVSFLIIVLFGFTALHAQQQKVAMLEPLGTASSMQKAIIRASLSEAITNSGTYEALSRSDIDQVMNEFNFQLGGMVDDEQRKELGRMSGAELLCVTRLTSDGSDFFVESSLIDMESGRIVKTANELMAGSPNSKIKEGCEKLAAKLVGAKDTQQTSNANQVTNSQPADNSQNCATLHIYRLSKTPVIGYDVYVGDKAVGKIKPNSKTTVQICTLGENTVWAKTETKDEISINFESGQEYYIRCSMKMGVTVGRPKLELVHETLGKTEFNSVKIK